MRRILVDARRPARVAIDDAVAVLRAGGIVLYPTDTLYGLAADATSDEAVRRLYLIKDREIDRAVPLIAASASQVEAFAGALTPLGRRLADRFWPGPLTLILPSSDRLAPSLHGGRGRIAVRVPAHAVARELAARFGAPVTSTSANRSGRPASATVEDAVAGLERGVDLVLDAGPTPGGPPSTIVDVCGDEPHLVREGTVPWSDVLEFVR